MAVISCDLAITKAVTNQGILLFDLDNHCHHWKQLYLFNLIFIVALPLFFFTSGFSPHRSFDDKVVNLEH